MFFIRSAFWLTIAFVLMAPKGTDLGATMAEMRDEAIAASVSAGTEIIVSTVVNGGVPAKGAAIAELIFSSSPSIDPTMQDSSIGSAPFPRPRPDWMG